MKIPLARLLVLVALVVGFADIGTAWGQGEEKKKDDPFDGAKPLSDPNDPAVARGNAKVLGRIEDGLDFLEALEPDLRGDELKEKIKRIVKEIRRKILDGGLYLQEDPKMTAGAAVRGFGADPTTKDIVFKSSLFQAADPHVCTQSFIDLLDALVHEGKHLIQNNREMPEDTINNVIRWKLERAQIEAQAYKNEQMLKRQLAAFLGTMETNKREGHDAMDGVTAAGMSIFKDCSADALSQLSARASATVADREVIIQKLIALYIDELLNPRPLEEVLAKNKEELNLLKEAGLFEGDVTDIAVKLRLENELFHNDYLYSTNGDSLSVNVDSESGTVGGKPVPGIRFPQAILLVRDLAGMPHLLVIGYNVIGGASGAIITMPAEPGAVKEVPAEGGGTKLVVTNFDFSNHRHRDVVTGNPQLAQPTDLAVSPDGTIFVWDPGSLALYRLVDSDGDGLVDSADFRNRIVPPKHLPVELEGYASADIVGNSVMIQVRIISSDNAGDAPAAFFTDRDGDGVYEDFRAVRPSQRSSRPPVFADDGVAGTRWLEVSGAPTHRIEARVRPNVLSSTEQEEVIGRGAISGRGESRLQLRRPLRQGEVVRVVDRDNGRSSGFVTVGPAGPDATHMEPVALATATETRVLVLGHSLNEIAGVLVNGRPVEMRTRGSERLVFVAPPAGRSFEPIHVQFRLMDGSTIDAPHFLWPSYDY